MAHEDDAAAPAGTEPAGLRILAHRPDPRLWGLPWHVPLEEWDERVVVPLPRGLSRHVVRIVRVGEQVLAVKETTEPNALREHRTLRDLHRLGLPAVVPQAVVTGRLDAAGAPLPAALVTEHLRHSLPYRTVFSNGGTAEQLTLLVDALVVLLVRLHLADLFWGDVSLSNVLFRRDAGAFAAYLVDAETSELKQALSDPLRAYDLDLGCENVFAELMDLQASGAVDADVDGAELVELLQRRYAELWSELTDVEEFSSTEMWRIEQRLERLGDLGFDVEELDVVTDIGGDTVRIRPRVVELGHHARELQELTGLVVEDGQARRLLHDLAAFTATFDLAGLDRRVVAERWRREVWEPFVALVPPQADGRREPAELFHEVLVHRWFLSERAGREVDLFETARDYVDRYLVQRPVESIAAEPPG
ncbi:DUF4032 domain-containing protein [Nocardioides sp. TRM66260-LWL]|uniref:DUF4032 domain-containing protein n=1 Tax=Nocardioides sp. TRM66260-LWL TaxID=2874478 RepID=UPI001CC65233|nr:DUF4032 domain-containing protein [Nocardioides sp. TRM66260-LWL]MBZ5734610.1 DUF4032 domain-containing protein [Nocardioides sp. TRM66260-LWL]